MMLRLVADWCSTIFGGCFVARARISWLSYLPRTQYDKEPFGVSLFFHQTSKYRTILRAYLCKMRKKTTFCCCCWLRVAQGRGRCLSLARLSTTGEEKAEDVEAKGASRGATPFFLIPNRLLFLLCLPSSCFVICFPSFLSRCPLYNISLTSASSALSLTGPALLWWSHFFGVFPTQAVYERQPVRKPIGFVI